MVRLFHPVRQTQGETLPLPAFKDLNNGLVAPAPFLLLPFDQPENISRRDPSLPIRGEPVECPQLREVVPENPEEDVAVVDLPHEGHQGLDLIQTLCKSPAKCLGRTLHRVAEALPGKPHPVQDLHVAGGCDRPFPVPEEALEKLWEKENDLLTERSSLVRFPPPGHGVSPSF
jgi:hypothetical protein